jgi:hypothetical protein
VKPRSAAIVTFHLLVALIFFGMASFNVYHGQTVNAVMQSVIAALVLSLGIGLARAA